MIGVRTDAGSSPVETLLCIALLLVPMGLLVAVLPTWVEHQHAARTAAREATRVAAHAPDHTAAVSAGQQAAAQVLTNHGVAGGDIVAVDLAVDAAGERLERGGQVSADVSVRVPAHRVPFLSQLGGFTVTASHTERIDDYRSLP